MKFSIFLTIRFLIILIMAASSSNTYSLDAEVIKLNLLSWNVWFNDKTGVTRYPEIINEINTLSPNIVFLQEVTPKFIRVIQDSKAKQNYHLSASEDSLRSYGQAFLTNQRLLVTEEYSLMSKYGRDALFGLYKLSPTQAIILVNVHLESGLFESDVRQEQVLYIRSELLSYFKRKSQKLYPEKKIVNVIWGGDFNFGYNEFTAGVDSFVDVGRSFEDNTPTYHLENNKLAKYTASLFEDSARLDRVLMSPRTGISALFYMVMNSDYYSTLSDHYPIHVKLKFDLVSKYKER